MKYLREKGIRIFLLFMIMMFSCSTFVCSEEYYDENGEEYYEEEEEEEEFIPEEYYDPIQSNDIPGWPQGQAIQAASAVVMDLDTNTVLYSKSAYDQKYPASITKIMTCMVALEHGNLDEEIEFSEIVYQIEEDSSHQGIQPGEKMTLRQALNGLMLESANDIANGLAEHFGGSISGFADMMNEKASSLGCTNTHFSNPHGLHSDDHYTCAHDMALIAQAAYAIPEFKEIVSTELFYCPPTNTTEEERYFYNHHKMMHSDSDYYYDYTIGGKTGFTQMAWNTLVTYAEKDGKRLVCVLLHENGAGMSYDETKILMDYGFNNFDRVVINSKKEPTFYHSAKLDPVGRISKMYQTEHFNEQLMEWTPGLVTLPSGASENDLTLEADWLDQGTGKLHYSYHGVPVGVVYQTYHRLGQVQPLRYQKNIVNLQPGVQMKRSPNNELEATAKIVLDKVEEYVMKAYRVSSDFYETNKLMVLLVGALILFLLLIIVFILILRCTRDSRIQKKRRQTEKIRLRREEEIDRMTTAEIEVELREAMGKEQSVQKEKE